MSAPLILRNHTEVARFLAGLDALDPGVVTLDRWPWHDTPGARPTDPKSPRTAPSGAIHDHREGAEAISTARAWRTDRMLTLAPPGETAALRGTGRCATSVAGNRAIWCPRPLWAGTPDA
jgi:hypothetical protein